MMPDLRKNETFHVLTSLYLKQEGQPFWQRNKTFTVGWFLDRTCKWYTFVCLFLARQPPPLQWARASSFTSFSISHPTTHHRR